MRKKALIKIGVLPLLTVSAVSVALPLSIHNKNIKEKQFKNIKLFNKTFHSREEFISYALQNSQIFSDKKGGNYYSLEDSGEKLFKTNEALRSYISENIETIMVKNAVRIDNAYLGGAGEIENINPILGANKSNVRQYFRGMNDTIFTKRIDAINSYFQYHKVYYYDGIAFRNTEELKGYLFKNYDALQDFKLQGTTVNIESPDGLSSDFINLDKKEGREKGRQFIKNTATSLIGLKRKDGKYNYIKKSELLSGNFNNAWENLPINEINAVHLKSNDGKATWIVDSSASDQANFYGDYFTKSKTNEIINIKQKNKWDKTDEKLTPSSLEKNRNMKTIASLFIILNKISSYDGIDLNNNNELKNVNNIKNIFDVPKYKKLLNLKGKNLDVEKLNNIFSELRSISNAISHGKRYNPLYELPLLYEKVLTNVDEWKLNNSELNVFRNFFQTIADDYQNTLEALFSKSAMVDRDNHLINISSLFGINKSSYDLNSTPEFEMYKLVESPKFIAASKLLISAINNKVSNGGAIKYSMTHFSYESEIVDQNYYRNLWNLLASDEKNINIKEISKHLSNNLTNTQLNIISNIMKVNDKFVQTSNEIYWRSNLWKLNKIIKIYSKNGYIDLTKPQYSISNIEDGQLALDWYHKVESILSRTHGYSFSGKISITKFKEKIQKLTIKDIASVRMFDKIKNIKSSNSNNIKSLFNYLEKISFAIQGVKLEKILATDKKISKALNNAKNIASIVLESTKFVNAIQNKDSYAIFKSASKIFGGINEMTKSIPVVGTVIKVLSIATDVIAEVIGKKEHQTYKFKTSEQNSHPFYWDGGESTSRLWGTLNTVDKDAGDMKMIFPQKISRGRKDDVWIYNGVVFVDKNELRKQALLDFSNGDDNAVILGSKNKLLKRSFSYNKKAIQKGQITNSVMVWDSKEKLAQSLLPLLSNKNPQNESEYDIKTGIIKDFIGLVQLSIIGGKVIQASGTNGMNSIEVKKVSINELISKIKPTIVVQLPKKINEYPIDQFDRKTLGLKTETIKNIYKIPGLKYYKNGSIKISDNHNQYLQLNMNEMINSKNKNINSKNKYKSIENVVEKLRGEFIKSISVKTISSLESQFLNSNHFSKLTTPKEFNLYKTKGVNGEIKYFKTFSSAVKWLSSKNQFYVKNIISKNQNNEIKFNDIKFKNTNELLKYLDNLWKENNNE